MIVQTSTVAFRPPPETSATQPAATHPPQPPHPRSTDPSQSTPKNDAGPHDAPPPDAPATPTYPAKPDPNVADPPSHHPPAQCCDDHVNPPSPPMAVAATARVCGCGSASCSAWPTSLVWRSASTTCHRAPAVESTTGAVAVGPWSSCFRRLSPVAGALFLWAMAPFPVAARQTGHADLPHPAFSCVIKPSRSAGRSGGAAACRGRASRRDTRPDTGDTRCLLVHSVEPASVADVAAHTNAPTCRSAEPALG